MPTTSQILGLNPAATNAAVFTVSGEAGPGRDRDAVMATILTRLQSGKYGSTIPQIVKAPNQFEANNPYTLQQVTDAGYGRKVYGKKYDEVLSNFENPNNLISILPEHGGATQFRGLAALGAKKPGDPMFDPRGNFFLPETRDKQAAQALMQRLKKGATQDTQQGQTSQAPQQPSNTPGTVNNYYIIGSQPGQNLSPAGQYLEDYKNKLISQALSGSFTQSPSATGTSAGDFADKAKQQIASFGDMSNLMPYISGISSFSA